MTIGTDPVTATTHYLEGEPVGLEFTGLTKREHFAAMAMQGMLSGDLKFLEGILKSNISIHQAAVAHADGLIEALNTQEAK